MGRRWDERGCNRDGFASVCPQARSTEHAGAINHWFVQPFRCRKGSAAGHGKAIDGRLVGVTFGAVLLKGIMLRAGLMGLS